VFGGLVLASALAAGTVIVASRDGSEAPESAGATVGAALPAGDTLVYRALNGNDLATFGKVGYTTLRGDAPAPTSAAAPLECDRVHAAGGRGICLKRSGALRYSARVFDAAFTVTHELPLTGLPSRTRVSRDGRYGAITAFTRGHNYARPGQFSTATTIVELASGRSLANLEEFTVTRDGEPFRSVDFNFWGVSFFPDSDRFVATLATRGKTYLVTGDVAARRMSVVRENVECPSLAPSGDRVAFKKKVGSRPGQWRFHVVHLATGRETPLAETRAIDDQLEWLDDDTLLYGFAEDIWRVPADGSGEPQLFRDGADSPAAIRPAQR
jgi:hypothetical protein